MDDQENEVEVPQPEIEQDLEKPDESTEPSASSTLNEAIRSQGEQIAELRGFRETLGQVFTVLAIIAAFTIALLTWIGVSGAIDDVVEERVNLSVDQRVGAFETEMNSRLADAESAASRAENAVGRAESAAASSSNAAATSQAISAELSVTATQAVIAGATGNHTIIVSSPDQLADALDTADNVREQGYDPTIYKVGEVYVVALGRFETQQLAQELLVEARARIHPTSYLFNLAEACPFTQYFQSGFYGCFLTPQE